MGCASSRPMGHNTHRHHRSPAWSGPNMLSFETHYGPKFMFEPPAPVARGRSEKPHLPHKVPTACRGEHTHTHHQVDRHGKSYAHQRHSRGISPLRWSEQIAPLQSRSVSPLGSSRFEQPPERAYLGNGKFVTTRGCNFKGGIGEWETW